MSRICLFPQGFVFLLEVCERLLEFLGLVLFAEAATLGVFTIAFAILEW
jgi:hypothetical protein